MIPPDVVEKLQKQILLLTSNHDGEVVAAAHAIERTLKAANLDMHALAASIRSRSPVRNEVWRNAAYATPGFNYANVFWQATQNGLHPTHPDASSPRFGLCLYTTERVETWREVGRHCLELNRKIPKRYGGRFLREFEIKLLEQIKKGGLWPTNTQVAWLERVVAQCHQVRDAQRRAGAE
ncbi:hypothetical protein MMB17_18390 [Methylobacterium organophilum]|uniref:hypothetical protein n=1 Tax=Methylobacterium organophilum TaxID=410 RepID=UPI001F145132|nr:hypothetical protein [Methylobacterium organophilum]UMY16633.1 hypothetical protein MMB17_18390 [Methylobacterium organophilum]